MVFQNWAEVIVSSLQGLWGGFVAFIPSLIGAIIILVLGWLTAATLGRLTERILRVIQADKIFDSLGIMKAVHKSGLDWEFSGFIGWLARWFLIIAFFLAATDVLGLEEVASFLNSILAYVPNVFVAALILLIAALVSDFLERVIKGSMKAAGFAAPGMLGVVVRWSVWVFAFLAILDQLGIAENLVNTLFMGFVAFLAIAGGLSFGLGGQGVAKEVLEMLAKEMRGKK